MPRSDIKLPEHLFQDIQKRLQKEAERRYKNHAMIFFACILASVTALVPLAFLLDHAFIDSGFITLASLLFTDATAVFSNVNTYLFSLLETIPVTNLLIVSFVLFLFFESLQRFLRNLHSLHPNTSTSRHLVIS